MMQTSANAGPTDDLSLASVIVAAYVGYNPVRPDDLANLIASVHGALVDLRNPESLSRPATLVPAVSIKRSLNPDFLICLDDGKRFKSLQRHLAGLGMTPDQYRAKWNLPSTYPMVAPNYAATRSKLAEASGLGTKPKAAHRRSSGR